MYNNNIKTFENAIEKEILKEIFGLEESIVKSYELKEAKDYVLEEDEIDYQGYVIKAKNLNQKLIERHYEVLVEKEDNKTEICPHCGKITSKIHDYRIRMIQHVPNAGDPVFFKYRVKRFRCPDCLRNFPERNKDFPRGRKISKKLELHILDCLQENVSRATVARQNFVSQNKVKEILKVTAFRKKKYGEVLCIDEFKGNLEMKIGYQRVKEKYQTLIKNPVNGEIIDILGTRDTTYLTKYFSDIELEERLKVKYFICDMNPAFISMGKKYFPNALVAIDRFHYTRVITNAFEIIRKRAQNRVNSKERVAFKRSRHLFLEHREKLLAHKDRERMEERLEEMMRIAPELKRPYELLQMFYEFNKSDSRHHARLSLMKFYESVERSRSEEFKKAAKTIRRHEKDILNSFETHYSNAHAEGTNNLIKVAKRVGYGLRSLELFRKRLELIVENYRAIKEKELQKAEIKRIRRLRKEYRNEIKTALENAA